MAVDPPEGTHAHAPAREAEVEDGVRSNEELHGGTSPNGHWQCALDDLLKKGKSWESCRRLPPCWLLASLA
eukprot:1172147-Amphidinium_carterae.1